MQEKKLSEGESLQLIEQMIGRAREEEKDSGSGWIIWGWLLFTASLIHYSTIVFDIKSGRIIWMVFGVLALLLMAYTSFRRWKAIGSSRVRTYTGELVDKIGIAFFISLLVMVVGNMTTGINSTGENFGFLLLLYGFWMYIHASAFRFQLLKFGAFANWAGALVIFIWHEDLGRNILLVHAACVALGYLIPGYVSQKRYSLKNKL